MQHLTIGVFGNKEFAKKLGKQGNVNDIAMYSHADSERVYTYVVPNSVDNKIQTLLQCISMVDVPVIVTEEVTKELAEQIVALDAFSFERGFVISKNESIKQILIGTTLEKFEWLQDEKELIEKLKDIQSPGIANDVWIPIDNYFNVKSVGTVVLCVVKAGDVKKHDKLMIQPLGKEVLVKSLQSQDKDIDEAGQGVRLGLSLKGVEADEIKRGFVLCREAKVSKNIIIEFRKSKFSKEAIEEGSQVFVSVGLQVVVGKVEKIDSDKISLALEQPIAYFSKQKCVIASTKQNMPRIIGSGGISQ
ncbi:MAG: EF-Tu/IF-2/RF-3 family GTPase [Candidatus Aenigmarchaeota archaeon]|nr:EF-Tu/IF-2/RF-3 family GTPase [Candidatus Aenigmarchaeota archaeon]